MSQTTRDALMDSALQVVRRQGYAGFSYADLAAAVGIRKPSIHHHFPAKEDLAEALVRQYTDRFLEQLDHIRVQQQRPRQCVDGYADLYRAALTRGEACLCGVLASEITVLPARVQKAVRRFFELNLAWLEQVVADLPRGSRRAPGAMAQRTARTILSTMQGAMFLSLSTQDPATFDEVVAGLLATLKDD